MKMLFFSSDQSEVQMASIQFGTAGIPCEIRSTPLVQQEPPDHASAELWIRDDSDSNRALMLCVKLGIGFSRRPRTADPFEDYGPEPAELLQVEEEVHARSH